MVFVLLGPLFVRGGYCSVPRIIDRLGMDKFR